MILFTFSITYIIRGLCNQFVTELLDSYLTYILDLGLTILFDCVPIMLMLVLHYKNFRE